MKNSRLIQLQLLAAVLILGLELLFKSTPNASLLFNLTFWVGLVQGAIALVAAVELADSKWLLPVRKHLLSLAPLLPFFAFLCLLLAFNISIYPWVNEDGIWLSPLFFLLRNFVLILLTFLLAHKLSQSIEQKSPSRNFFALTYILTFIVSQSLVAFDWVMSLEHPWFSSLFGAFFFVEAVFGAVALSLILCTFLPYKKIDGTFRYGRGMLQGFSLFWAYLVFSQYIVIWYGNMPEEVSFLVKRTASPQFMPLSYLILTLLFIIPFVLLLFLRIKKNLKAVSLLCWIIFIGFLLEKVLFIAPAAKILSLTAFVEFAAISFVVFSALSASLKKNPSQT